jgi:hypothetical protein
MSIGAEGCFGQWSVHKTWHEGLVMCAGHCFGEEVCEVESAGEVSDSKLSLFDTVA